MIRLIGRFFARSMRDFEPGDFVRRVGFRWTGWIESVNGDYATVALNKDRREIVPLVSLRRTKPCGHELDRRRG